MGSKVKRDTEHVTSTQCKMWHSVRVQVCVSVFMEVERVYIRTNFCSKLPGERDHFSQFVTSFGKNQIKKPKYEPDLDGKIGRN